MKKVYRGLEYHKYRVLTFIVGLMGMIIFFSSCSNISNKEVPEAIIIQEDSISSDSAKVEAKQDTTK